MAKVPGAYAAGYLLTGGFSGTAWVISVAIAIAESGLDITAKGGPNSNGSYDWGLMQINDVHHPTEAQKTNPIENAKMAVSIYRAAGGKFTPWATYNSGSYKKHMAMANVYCKAWQKLPAETKATVIKRAGTVPLANEWPTTGQVTDIVGATAGIGGSINGFSATLNKGISNIGIILVAVVLLVLGVVLLTRNTGAAKVAQAAVKVIK